MDQTIYLLSMGDSKSFMKRLLFAIAAVALVAIALHLLGFHPGYAALAAFPNLTDITATTIDSRSRKIADNVTRQNGTLTYLRKRGNVKPFSGGEQIVQEFSFAENGNAGWYSGYDLLPVAAQDVISGAKYPIKQLAVPVLISGLEQLQNSGREQMIDLLEARLEVAENTMANQMSLAIYGDGTGSGGKTLTGLGAAVPTDPTTGTYGGIDRSLWPFWRSQIANNGGGYTAANIQPRMNTAWAQASRGADVPDLIVFDNSLWGFFMNSLQLIQRFVDTEKATLGFPSVKFMTADVILDGGIGGFQAANTGHLLNTKYIFLRPHKDRDFVALDPNKRYATNQDAVVSIMAWAGNLTSNGAQFQEKFV